MSDDRSLAPSPTRLGRAWRAGLRPRSAWLLPAAVCGGLALVLDKLRSATVVPLDLRPGAIAPSQWLNWVGGWLATLFIVAAFATAGVALLSRRLGAVSSVDRRRLRAASARPEVFVRVALVLVLGAGLVLTLVGVLAGAARSVDASEQGLTALWLGWALRGAATLAMALGLAAFVDLLLDRRDRIARLFQSHQQRRDEARDAGGGAR